ncbi:MAG: hypothetical protein VW349_09480, partial [Gammaproteobacteria bacterium]
IINGQQSRRSYVDHVFTLRAKTMGRLSIPSLTVGTEQTSPIPVSVVAQSQAAKDRMQQILFFETLVSEPVVYVQGQLIYTVRLYYADSISGDFPAPPAPADTIVEILVDEKRFETIFNNKRYYVLEKQYALFPQQSGELVLAPETFIGTRGRGGIFSSRERVSAVSKGHSITVKPQPPSFTGRSWLPAQAFSGEQVINLPDGLPKVGDPINRVIELKGVGISGALIPDITLLEPPGARVYLDQPVTEEFSDARGLSAESSITAGIVPTEPGELILEEIRIPWWNTVLDREEVVVLPQRTIQVLPAQLTSDPFKAAPALPIPTETDDHPGLLLELRIWQGISLILGLGWLFYYAMKREPSIPAPVSDAPSPSFELGTLKQACRSGDPRRALAQLRSWQQSRFEDARSLSGLVERFPVLAAPIQHLEQSLYGGGEASAWQGDALLAAVLEVDAKTIERAARAGPLVAHLNPQS